MTLLLIAVAGALGAVARYALSGWTYGLVGTSFPYGTLAVNMLGCFLLGAVQQIGEITDLITEQMRFAIAVGFLGALTTFSTFGYETLLQLENGNWPAAFGNVTAHLVVGLLAVWAGMTLARVTFGGA